jgi:hypothetical protein
VTSASGISIACVFMYMYMRACGVCVDKERKKVVEDLKFFAFSPLRVLRKKIKKNENWRPHTNTILPSARLCLSCRADKGKEKRASLRARRATQNFSVQYFYR